MRFTVSFLIWGLLFLPTLTFSQTVVPPGEVSGSWTAADSPYLIQGNITISVNNTLTIAAGVDVIFPAAASLTIQGTLLADGTDQYPVRFFAEDSAAGWGGLHFIAAGTGSYLQHCLIQDGWSADDGGGAYILNSHPTFEHCLFYNNTAVIGGGAVLITGTSSPYFLHCRFIKNYAEYGAGLYVDTNSSPTLQRCLIAGNIGVPG